MLLNFPGYPWVPELFLPLQFRTKKPLLMFCCLSALVVCRPGGAVPSQCAVAVPSPFQPHPSPSGTSYSGTEPIKSAPAGRPGSPVGVDARSVSQRRPRRGLSDPQRGRRAPGR